MEPTSNPTQLITTGFPTSEPTLEPTVSPTQSPAPTAAPTEPTYTEVEIVITISFTSTNATEEELTDLILLAIDEVIASLNLTVLDFDADDFTVEIISSDTDTSARRLIAPSAATYTFRITLSILDEPDIDAASALIQTIESPEFAGALQSDIEAATYSEIAEDGLTVSAEAVPEDTDDDDDDKVDWLDYTTWELINWLMVGAVLLVLCVFGLCVCRCCCLVCCCKEQRERRQSQYKMGGAMFDRVDSHNTGKEHAFQSDLRQAIEMNKRGTLLKKKDKHEAGGGKESLELDAKEIGAAFDMNFDEVTPIKDKEVAKPQARTKGKEGGDETGDPLIRGTTPGGPEEDDDENVPPAPKPPVMSAEEEEAAEAYDLL